MRIGSLVRAADPRDGRREPKRALGLVGIVIAWRPCGPGFDGERIFEVLFVDGSTMEFYACGLKVISL